MSESLVGLPADQVIRFFASVVRYRRHIMSVLPEDLAREKERVEKVYLNAGSKRPHDQYLFYRIGQLLSKSGSASSMGELSKALDVPMSTATRIVDELVENGYAERIDDPDDRRIVRITLTKDGQLLYQALYNHMQHNINQILAPFTPSEINQLIGLLEKAASRMDEIST